MAQQRGMKRAEKVLKRTQKKRKAQRENNLKLLEGGKHAGHSHAGHDHDHDHEHEEKKEEKPKAKKTTKKKEAAE
jgi:hypothetical protein